MTRRASPTVVRTDVRRAVPLDLLLERWLAAGVITVDQAERMVATGGTARAARRGRTPLAAEALAYVGAAVVLAGAGLLATYFWSDLGDGARLTVVASAGVLLFVAGAAVPAHSAAGRRLRSVLWLASTAAWAGTGMVLFDGVLASQDLADDTVAVLVAAATTAYATGLWVALRYGLQQAAMMVAAASLAAALAARLDLPGEPGLGVWVVGVLWSGLGLTGVLVPAETPIALGAATAVFGAMTTAGSDGGMALVLTTVAAVLAVALLRHDLVLLGVAAVAALVNVPAAIARWFAGSAPAAIALLLAGGVLVGLAVWMTRRSGRGERPRLPGPLS